MAVARNPLVRSALFVTGLLVIAVSPLVGAIPGPGGVFVFAAGLVLVLRNSAWARKRFCRAKRRWPRFGHYADMALRRRSARRRRLREKEGQIARAEAELLGLGTKRVDSRGSPHYGHPTRGRPSGGPFTF